MKTNIILFISIILIFSCCTFGEVSYGEEYSVQLGSVAFSDNKDIQLPDDIQSEIKNTFVKSLMSKDDSDFLKLNNTLEEALNKTSQNIFNYWIAYLKYYHSIYYLQFKNNEKSEKLVQEGIDILENFDKKIPKIMHCFL